MAMEVILLEDVEHLGYKDDVVNVKPGYARNFLIPQHKALVANASQKKALEEKKRQQAQKIEKVLNEYRSQAQQLESSVYQLGAKVGTSGKIFGSVTSVQLADAIKNKSGIEVDRKKIKMGEDVKTLGTYQAEVELYKDVKATVQYEVVAE